MATINLGNIRFNWCGEYVSSTQYTKDDVVGFGGSSWIARKNVKGVNPAKNEFWDLMISGAEKPYVIGEQKLMAFRSSELPFGWYLRNGDNYLLESPQGRALNSLSANYKEDYKITIKVIDGKDYINVPTAFHSDGRGFYERAVDGVTRRVGSVIGDEIRNIIGSYNLYTYDNTFSGALAGIPLSWNALNTAANNNRTGFSTLSLDASRVVPTGPENKVLDIGMTPAIYLGV